MAELFATILAHMSADVLWFPWLKVLGGALGWLIGWWLRRKEENAASQQQRHQSGPNQVVINVIIINTPKVRGRASAI